MTTAATKYLVSSLPQLEDFVVKFVKEKPKSTVKKYFDTLKECLQKGATKEEIRTEADKLLYAFPGMDAQFVKRYLKELIFQDSQWLDAQKANPGAVMKQKPSSMASQGSSTYSLVALEKELKKFTPCSIQEILTKLTDHLKKADDEAAKTFAKELLDEIDRKGTEAFSSDGRAFLKHLQNFGHLHETSTNPRPGATIVPVGQSSPITEKAKIHQRSKASDQEKIDDIFQSSNRSEGSGQAVGSQTMKPTGRAPDAPKQPPMSSTLPATSASSAKQLIAGGKESDPVTEVLQLIQDCLSSDSLHVPKSVQTQPIALEVINGIRRLQEDNKKLTEENKRLSYQKDNKILSLAEELKTSKQTLQKLEQQKRDVEDAYNKSCVANTAEKADIELKFNEHLEQEHQLRVQLQSDFNQLQKSKEMVEDKLRKTTKESADLLEQFQQHAEDNARQKQKLSEEVHRLHRDNKELKSRVSELAGAKLMDNNPDIADLSDPNRALKLGEKFSSLYDDDWTDAYQTYTEKFNMKEDEAIHFLLQVLLKTYDFCRKVADEQMDCLCNVFENPCQDIPKALTMKPQKEKPQITQKQYKDLKDLRKQIGLRKAGSITKQYVSKEYEEVKKGDKKLKSMLDETKSYYEKCVEVCWPMVLHDPPVRMEYPIKPGIKIDGNRFRLYGGNGDVLEYLVWPPLLVEGGGLLAKGVAKPKKTARTVKKP